MLIVVLLLDPIRILTWECNFIRSNSLAKKSQHWEFTSPQSQYVLSVMTMAMNINSQSQLLITEKMIQLSVYKIMQLWSKVRPPLEIQQLVGMFVESGRMAPHHGRGYQTLTSHTQFRLLNMPLLRLSNMSHNAISLFTLSKKRDRIISLVKRHSAQYIKRIHKFGMELPKTAKEALMAKCSSEIDGK